MRKYLAIAGVFVVFAVSFGGTMTLLNIQASHQASEELAAAATVTSQKDILAILVDFDDVQPDVASDNPVSVQTKLDEVNKFYMENDSSGALQAKGGFSYDVTPGYVLINDVLGKLTSKNIGTLFPQWLSSALKQVQAVYGINPKNYKYVYFITPQEVNCGVIGFCKTVVLNNDSFDLIPEGEYGHGFKTMFINGDQTGTVYAHELGHAVGLEHFGTLNCSPNDIGPIKNCVGSNYGPTVMGDDGSFTHFSAIQKEKLGYITNGTKGTLDMEQAVTDQTLAANGIYALTPIETIGSGVKDLVVTSPSGNTYHIEYRSPINPNGTSNFDAISNVDGYGPGTWITMSYDGVNFTTKKKDENAPEALLLKTLSDATSTFTDSIDPLETLVITQVNHTNSSDTVQVQFNKTTFNLGGTLLNSTSFVNNACFLKNTPVTVSLTSSYPISGSYKYQATLNIGGINTILNGPSLPLVYNGSATDIPLQGPDGNATDRDVKFTGHTTIGAQFLGGSAMPVYATIVVKNSSGTVIDTYTTPTQYIIFPVIPAGSPLCTLAATAPSMSANNYCNAAYPTQACTFTAAQACAGANLVSPGSISNVTDCGTSPQNYGIFPRSAARILLPTPTPTPSLSSTTLLPSVTTSFSSVSISWKTSIAQPFVGDAYIALYTTIGGKQQSWIKDVGNSSSATFTDFSTFTPQAGTTGIPPFTAGTQYQVAISNPGSGQYSQLATFTVWGSQPIVTTSSGAVTVSWPSVSTPSSILFAPIGTNLSIPGQKVWIKTVTGSSASFTNFKSLTPDNGASGVLPFTAGEKLQVQIYNTAFGPNYSVPVIFTVPH